MPRTIRALLALAALIVCGSIHLSHDEPWWVGTWEYTDTVGEFGLLEVEADGRAALGPPDDLQPLPLLWRVRDGGISLTVSGGIFGRANEYRLLLGPDGTTTLTSIGGLSEFDGTPVRRSDQLLPSRAERDAFIDPFVERIIEDRGR